MNQFQRGNAFSTMPVVVKNLLIINGLFFLATWVLQNQGIDLTRTLGAFYYESPYFRPWQIVAHMFMHGNLMHIFFNMFALWMFGTAIERVWGPKRFLIYYFITGFGAFVLHYAVVTYEAHQLIAELGPQLTELVRTEGSALWAEGKTYTNPTMFQLQAIYNIPVVGASGAVFGILLAFGMMFPNMRLIFLFFPVPIKAKYFVMLYGAFELFSGITNRPGDNVAHFAHIGGMLFGYLLIRYWRSRHNQTFL